MYVANRNIWHTKEQRRYLVGDIVPLDHLTKDEIENLVKLGTVSECKSQPRRKPRPKKRG